MYHLQFPQVLGRAHRALERMRYDLVIEAKPLQMRYAQTKQHLSFTDKDQLDYQPLEQGQEWGRSDNLQWVSAWIEAKADLTQEWPDWQQKAQALGAEIAIEFHLSGEGLVFDRTGKVIQGISGGSLFKDNFQRSLVRKAEPLLQSDGKPEHKLELWVEAAANTLFGLERNDDPSRREAQHNAPRYYGEYSGRVHNARIVLFDTALWQYLLDLGNATCLAETLLTSQASGSWGSSDTSADKQASPRAKRLLYAIDRALSCCANQRERVAEAHALLLKEFANGNAPSDLTTIAVGHAHIDTAWLWPIDETVRKCARTFSNQLRLMEHYPEYVFGASQAQHYVFVKEHYPQIYSQIQQRIKEGRWEVQGAMWIEADANLPSGESLVRQLLHGKNFFRDEFGVDITNLWLPDVFGYSANLPQILKRAGVAYFLTQKLSWSQYNDFPHHTFHWQGIDGSSVLTHFPPENTYHSTIGLGSYHGVGLAKAQNKYKEAHILNEFMTLYGVGDGGGGPDEAMVEQGLRLGASNSTTDGRNKNMGVEGSPYVRFGRADQFFEWLAEHSNELATWQGELYLELHRGTLTTQASNKRDNRRMEQALRLVEYLYSLNRELPYPQETLDKLWKMVLINQFHDIIPGSSIHEVYLHTQTEYTQGLALCRELQQQWQQQQPKQADCLSLVNPYSLSIQTLVKLPAGWTGTAPKNASTEEQTDCQILAATDGWALVRLAPQAIITLKAGQAKEAAGELKAYQQDNLFCLENEKVSYTFNSKGQITQAYDKEYQRYIFSNEGSQNTGAGNLLHLYQDWPSDWDAWDIDINYQDELLQQVEASTAKLLPSTGSLYCSLYFRYEIGNASHMEQTITLEAQNKRLSFCCQVDWAERHRMLRVGFEPKIYSQKASYDIQYGYVERATHRNTSWEMAQFEVVGQRYADLSAHDYGLTLLNDSKYGHQVKGNWLDLNLLRSSTLPDPDADKSYICGQHRFTYALLPHSGNLQAAMPQIQAEAARLNQPIPQFKDVSLDTVKLPIQVDSDNVTLEVLKKAEKSEYLVVRLVERAGIQSAVRLYFTGNLTECDLLEWHELPFSDSSGECELLFEPFAIRTFLLK